MSGIKILVVEDDNELRSALMEALMLEGYEVSGISNISEAINFIHKTNVDIIVSDVNFTHCRADDEVKNGIEFLRYLQINSIFIPFVLMTAYATVDRAVEALKLGAIDYLVKPFEVEQLVNIIEHNVSIDTEESKFIAVDDETVKVKRLSAQVAKSDVSVLINGESGTGKEVLAQYIHKCSDRADQPFIAINCAAIPENMLEAILFGYEKGAFTGAYAASSGKFEQAQGGTLLLDEITEMDISLQAKLLRVLQEKQVERLGGKKIIELNVRILATTNRDLRLAVSNGEFREDLYYRLSVFPISLKPLRERPADIMPILEALLQKHQVSSKKVKIDDQAMGMLEAYHWPGNVREVDNVIQRAIVLSGGEDIRSEHIVIDAALTVDQFSVEPEKAVVPVKSNLKQNETNMILEALEVGHGSRKYAAETLGISPRTLRYKLARLKEQGVEVPPAYGMV